MLNNKGQFIFRYPLLLFAVWMINILNSSAQCPGGLGTGVVTVPSLPYSSGAGSSCGSLNDLTSANIISCGLNAYYGAEDRVWIFTPVTNGVVTITLTSSSQWSGLSLYKGCPLTGQGGTCVTFLQNSSANKTISHCVTAGQTYYLILDGLPPPNCNTYSNLTISAPAPVLTCNMGTGVNNIALPYSSTGRTTCGKVNDQDSSNIVSCGSSLYFSGEDEVFVFTPSATGKISVTLTASGSYTSLTLFQGCPLTNNCMPVSGTCIASRHGSSGNKFLCANVTAGLTYYLIVDSWSVTPCNPYSITITDPVSSLSGALCSNAIPVTSLPFNVIGESTACSGNDYSNASAGSCGTAFESGEDKVYTYTASGPECIGITLSGASSNSIGYQVYQGCPGGLATVCIGNNGGASGGTLSGSINLPSAGTYYIIIDSWAPPASVNYNLSIVSYSGGAANDLPCNATPIQLGVYLSSHNNCSGFASEPAAPPCWINPNTRNTVWFSVQAPASGQLRLKVQPSGLTNPQMAVYSGSCTALTYLACNDNAVPCGVNINNGSELTLTGLTPGNTYYVAVDGYNNSTGSFGIFAMDASQPLLPLTNGQDCGFYLPVCDTTMSYGDPGFQSFGNICDFNGSGGNCLVGGERGSVWMEVPIRAAGFLEFTILPKDWPGAPSTASTDYDFAVWKIQGSGAVNCSQIASGNAPLRCNYNILGVTGLYSAANGTAPPQYPGFNAAFNSRLSVAAGEKYVLFISNFSNSTSGFDLVFSTASPVDFAGSGSASLWTGGVDTDWFKKDNWGGCPIPTCGRDAIINGGTVLQPVLTTPASCKSLLINPGATLTLTSGVPLNICENFTNHGTFSSDPTSTVVFTHATANHIIAGNMDGANSFANLYISKPSGVVTAANNFTVKTDFTLFSATSTFNLNGKTAGFERSVYCAGPFLSSGGTVEFNGSVMQYYTNNGFLDNVITKHTGPGINLLSNLNISTSGSLVLNTGNIITNSFEVSVANRNPSSVTSGNPTSYIQGSLRRYLNSTGSYDFPVGHSIKGYQRALINFAYPVSPTSIDNLKVSFQHHASLPPPTGSFDCSVFFSSSALDNGKWIFNASNSPSTGNFDLTLFNTQYTNAANSWTIMQNNGSAWSLGSGTCIASPVTAVRRNNMNGIAPEYATAQAPTALPVTWLDFKALATENNIQLQWITATETDNSGFEIERSQDANDFNQIGWEDGAGNSSYPMYYSFTDYNVPDNQTYYYRLKQVDFNGNHEYSTIVSSSLNQVQQYLFSPNPATKNSTLQFNSYRQDYLNLKLLNAQGILFAEKEDVYVSKGHNELYFSDLFGAVPPGYYLLCILSEQGYTPVKVIVP